MRSDISPWPMTSRGGAACAAVAAGAAVPVDGRGGVGARVVAQAQPASEQLHCYVLSVPFIQQHAVILISGDLKHTTQLSDQTERSRETIARQGRLRQGSTFKVHLNPTTQTLSLTKSLTKKLKMAILSRERPPAALAVKYISLWHRDTSLT